MQVMINDRIFEGLSENQQNALVQAAKEAGDWYSEQRASTDSRDPGRSGTRIFIPAKSSAEAISVFVTKDERRQPDAGGVSCLSAWKRHQ